LRLWGQSTVQPSEPTLVDRDDQTLFRRWLQLFLDAPREDIGFDFGCVLDDPPASDDRLPLQLTLKSESSCQSGTQSGLPVTGVACQKQEPKTLLFRDDVINERVESGANVQVAFVRKPGRFALQ